MSNVLLGVVFLIFWSQGFCDDGRSTDFRDSEELKKFLTFRLYTRENPRNGVEITLGDKAKLISSGFKGGLPTLVCTHGYFDKANSSWIRQIKEDILKEQEVNFITLDYSAASHNLLYNELVNFTKKAGLYTGQFLKFLQTEAKLNLGKTHLIGHSLGAQLMGFASKFFPEKKLFGRLSALDPAGPLFENAPESERVNSESAKIVDVIHTCTFFVGMKKPVGTIDFYPNGGYNQPGCKEYDLHCQHSRAREYFYKTITKTNSQIYRAKKCENLENALNGTCFGQTATMGYHLNYSSPGIYYLKIKGYQ